MCFSLPLSNCALSYGFRSGKATRIEIKGYLETQYSKIGKRLQTLKSPIKCRTIVTWEGTRGIDLKLDAAYVRKLPHMLSLKLPPT